MEKYPSPLLPFPSNTLILHYTGFLFTPPSSSDSSSLPFLQGAQPCVSRIECVLADIDNLNKDQTIFITT